MICQYVGLRKPGLPIRRPGMPTDRPIPAPEKLNLTAPILMLFANQTPMFYDLDLLKDLVVHQVLGDTTSELEKCLAAFPQWAQITGSGSLAPASTIAAVTMAEGKAKMPIPKMEIMPAKNFPNDVTGTMSP